MKYFCPLENVGKIEGRKRNDTIINIKKRIEILEAFVNEDLKSMQEKLSKMFEVLESDPQLMSEYKQAIEKLKSKEEREL